MAKKNQSGSFIAELMHVSKSYMMGDLEVPVLKDASVKIEKGSFVVLLGVSGSGKSTLLNLIGGLDECKTGKILIDGENIVNASQNTITRFRREKIGFIFQFYNLFSTLTAWENVATGLEILNLSRKEVSNRTMFYLQKVGLDGKHNKFPTQLSGGEQQRVAIARALAKNPSLVLADEPTGNLDEKTGKDVIDLMKSINVKSGTTFLVVTHNPVIADYADRVIEIHEGSIFDRK